MVLVTINGIEIDFPYPPYGAQIRYMSLVIDGLRNGHNALLESPTGTGKTLCLLCASLAWRATYIAALQANTHSNRTPETNKLLSNAGLRPLAAASSALAALVRPGSEPSLSAPRIIFASRTHSQLAQAVAELKKTIYSPAMVMLASRDQLCIHEISNNHSGSRLNAMCRRITAPSRRQCRYHLPVASNRPHENRCPELVDKLQNEPPMDIEDLRDFGFREAACPYYLARAAARSDVCEILFLPYSYILDRSVRGSLDIDWSNDIVIIDEAHNLESVCTDSMSFDLTPAVRIACDAELSKLVESAIRPGGVTIPALEELAKTESGLESVIGSENREVLEIRLMRSILISIEQFIAAVCFNRGEKSDIAFRVFPGGQLRKIMESAGGPTSDSYELFLEMLDKAIGIQSESAKLAVSASDAHQRASSGQSMNAISALQNAIRVLFESVISGDEEDFRTVVQEPKTASGAGRTISYWCFKPSVAMKSLQHLSLRCLVLTSGTLSPMDSFASELGLDFPIRLENPHVITKPQVWAGVIKSGPDVGALKGNRLTSAFYARGEASSIELGRALIRIASIVPDGLLVFFPSYVSMYSSVEVWKGVGPAPDKMKPSIWEHLLRHKQIVMEERDSSKSAAAILAHRANVDNKEGSILMAVCRGKVSEGIDFSDEYGRAVVITGLPYPSAFDPKVVLKREFADEEARGSARVARSAAKPRKAVVSGSEWYTTQAVRAVNQAVGRAIRHRFDYGAIVLCEERFQSSHLHRQISKWIRPNLTICPNFGSAQSSLQSFFGTAVVSEFAQVGLQQRLGTKRKGMEAKLSRGARDACATEAVLIAKDTISHLLPPQQTDDDFLKQVLTFKHEATPAVTDRERRISPSILGSPGMKALGISSQSAQGGLLDSGSVRITPSPRRKRPLLPVPKRSTEFLAARAERVDADSDDVNATDPKPATRKRARPLPATNLAHRGPGLGSSKRKFSDEIRELFSNRDDQKEFLRLFKEVMSLGAQFRCVEGTHATHMSETKDGGREVVESLVRFTRLKAADTVHSLSFLQDLQTKIPLNFRGLYEAVIQSSNVGDVGR